MKKATALAGSGGLSMIAGWSDNGLFTDFYSRAQPSIMLNLPDQLQGLHLFPCVPNGKEPATRGGWHEASDDPAKIAEWLTINPNFNWACATGLSGLFVVDVDPNGLDWWAKLLERDLEIKAAVDRAFQVRTPRGGLHVYFRGEGPSTASRIADGIDTRGGIKRDGKIVSGGYVLLPGSHTDAGAYSPLPGGEIVELPDCIRAITPERKKTDTYGLAVNPDKDLPRNIQTARDLLTKYVADGRVSVQGKGGDNTAFAVVASVLDKGISPAVAYDLLQEIWNVACVPPWDEFELEQKIINAMRHGEDTESGAKGFQANASAFAAFEGQIYEAPKPTERRSRFKPMTLTDARKDVRPAKWLVPNFIPDTGAGIIYGISGTYKTFIALDWALCLAHGVAGQWGTPPVKHTVLFLAGESSYALRQERVDAWCEKWGMNPDDADFIIVTGVPAFADKEGWEEIRNGLLEMGKRPSFIVIDTLTRMMTGMRENDADDGKLLLNHCEEMADHYGAFVLGIGHTGKDQSKGMRGTQVFMDNSEAVHSLKKTATGTSLRTVKLKETDISDGIVFFEVEKIAKSIVLNKTENAPANIEGKGETKTGWSSVSEVVAVLNRLGGETNTTVLVQTIGSALGLDLDLVKRTLKKSADLAFLREGDRWKIPGETHDEPETPVQKYDL